MNRAGVVYGCLLFGAGLPALAATTTASTTTTAAAATTAVAAATAAATGTLARLADADSAALQLAAIQILDRLEGALFRRHLNEGEAARTARVTIHNQFHL
jgi:hypothetical protein